AAHVLIETAPRRVGEHAAHRAPPRLQVLRDPCEGAAGAGGGDEGIDAPVGLLPDLGSRGARVGVAVCGVGELVGPDGVGERAAGIHELRLAEDPTAGLLAHPLERNEGRVADRADEAAGGAAGRSALRAHAGTPGALARGSGAAPASVAAKAATSPSIRIEGGSIRCACASATMFESVPRRIRCPGSVARSMMAAGCPAAAPAASSLATMSGS